MNNIHIRIGAREDLKAVHDLVRELAIYEKGEADFVATLEDYQNDFAAGIFECLVAEKDHQIVGMALFYMSYSTWKGRMLYLEDFVVREAVRGHGIGQQLFDRLVEEARKRSCRLIKWQVLDWNKPAIRFYQKNEAIIEQEWWNGKLLL